MEAKQSTVVRAPIIIRTQHTKKHSSSFVPQHTKNSHHHSYPTHEKHSSSFVPNTQKTLAMIGPYPRGVTCRARRLAPNFRGMPGHGLQEGRERQCCPPQRREFASVAAVLFMVEFLSVCPAHVSAACGPACEESEATFTYVQYHLP